MPDKDPASKLKARLSKWQEYVDDVQERAFRPESWAAAVNPTPETPLDSSPIHNPAQAVAAASEPIREPVCTLSPAEQLDSVPEAGSESPPLGAPVFARSEWTEREPDAPPVAAAVPPPPDPPVRKDALPLERLVVDRIETDDAPPVDIDPGARRVSGEWRTGMRPDHNFDQSRLVNAVLFACLLVIIALIVGLSLFLFGH